ncbi:MAG: hypothetical protein KF809_04840 [Chloroflexi bacterium]|nr:hypothetical protein [Chloroflexota bacterium]
MTAPVSSRAPAGEVPLPDPGWLTAAAAANMAGWHDLHIRSLGRVTAWEGGLWHSTDVLPSIFFQAVAIRPGASTDVLARIVPREGWVAVCDPWWDMDPTALGFREQSSPGWMVRPAGPVPDLPPPAALSIERVGDTAGMVAFEQTAAVGFEAGVIRPGTWHGPEVARDPRLITIVGWADGRPAAVGMGFVEAGVIGVYGITTVPEARRRGFASSVTGHILAQRPDLPAVLQPSTMARPIYERLGFVPFGRFRTWARGGR